MSKRFFTSDLHWFHYNVIEFCARPFTDVDNMHEGLIRLWNETVGPKDEVYVLGDWGMCNYRKTEEITRSLNGTKYLIEGNHDWQNCKQSWKWLDIGFKWVYQSKRMTLSDGTKVMLSHFPFRPSDFELEKIRAEGGDIRYLESRLTEHDRWLLHGHVHTSWKVKGRQINVGVDVWNYRPVEEKKIIEIIKSA